MHLRPVIWSVVLTVCHSALAVLVLPGPCYQIANQAGLIFQSLGEGAGLCQSSGEFATALDALYSCSTSNSDATAQAAVTVLDLAISVCYSAIQLVGSSLAICCGTNQGARYLAECASTVTPNATQCAALATSSFFTTSTLASATPASSVAASSIQASTTSSPTAAPSASTNVGLIVGASVGGTLGAILIALAICFCVYTRRKRRKRRLELQGPSAVTEEKAQLHSDDIKPSEAPGAPVVLVRSVGGLEEIDGNPVTHSGHYFKNRELAANEEVGKELHGSYGEQRNDGSGSLGLSGSTALSSQR